MKLEALFEGTEYSLLCGTLDKDVKSLSYSSDKTSKAAAFFALKGEQSDGHDYIDALIKEGVEVFVAEDYNKVEYVKKLVSEYAPQPETDGSVTLIEVADSRRALAIASRNFFAKPDEELITVGITGTKGKTSTSYMLKSILEKAGLKSGIIGTVQQGFEGHYSEAVNTTPQSYEIYRMLREMADSGCKAVVMEVSSQALMQHRTDGIDFDIGIFTNLSPDHIGKGEHHSFEEYAYWKSRLFVQSKTAVVNSDSTYAAAMLEDARRDTATKLEKTLEYGLFQAKDIRTFREGDRLGMSFVYTEPQDSESQGQEETEAERGTEIKIGLPGVFNVYNALAAMKAAGELGIKASVMAEALAELSVRGRSETVPTGGDFTVILDYAHNGVALENLLKALRAYEPTALVAVFGCGGKRDRNRRFEMGKAAGRLADFTIVTSDNPRDEAAEKIIEDIVSAISETGGRYTVIPDRGEAIAYAIRQAKSGNIIAVCGKGHETYQLIGQRKIHFDDREAIKAVTDSQEKKK